MSFDVHCGDCLDVMAEMEENSVDTIITDPPYGLEFMGKDWDNLTRNLMNPASEADQKRKEEYGRSYAGRRSNLPDYYVQTTQPCNHGTIVGPLLPCALPSPALSSWPLAARALGIGWRARLRMRGLRYVTRFNGCMAADFRSRITSARGLIR